MESSTYVVEERGLPFPDDIELQVDGLLRNRNLLKGWEAETLLFSGRNGDESIEFTECCFHDMSRETVLVNKCLEISRGDCGKPVPLSSTIALKELDRKDDKSEGSCLVVEKLSAQTVLDDSKISKESSLLSSPEFSASAKRARVSSLIPSCQVLGCNKDLSSSKDYHKRHKVCEVHSKTAVVIVNGIRQRFCQQCSRFHILSEFDEGKRSCRKRLAGHNERRRKPQLDAQLGSPFIGSDVSKTSLFFSTIHCSSFFGKQCNEPVVQRLHMKLENELSQISELASSRSCLPSFQNSVLHSHCMGNQHSSRNRLNGPPSHQDLYSGSESGGALSLLSVQSQKVSTSSAGISTQEDHIQNSVESPWKSIFAANAFNLPNRFDQEKFSGAFAHGGSGIVTNGVLQKSNEINPKSSLPPEGANTLDLLQLSAHLQRIEQQKYSTRVEVGR